MFAWLAANAATIIITLILVVIVAFLIRAVATKKVGCSGDCAHCASGHSSPNPEEKQEDNSPCSACGACQKKLGPIGRNNLIIRRIRPPVQKMNGGRILSSLTYDQDIYAESLAKASGRTVSERRKNQKVSHSFQ